MFKPGLALLLLCDSGETFYFWTDFPFPWTKVPNLPSRDEPPFKAPPPFPPCPPFPASGDTLAEDKAGDPPFEAPPTDATGLRLSSQRSNSSHSSSSPSRHLKGGEGGEAGGGGGDLSSVTGKSPACSRTQW